MAWTKILPTLFLRCCVSFAYMDDIVKSCPWLLGPANTLSARFWSYRFDFRVPSAAASFYHLRHIWWSVESNFHMVLAGRLFGGLLTCRKVSEDGCVAGKLPKLTFFVENKNSHQSFRLIPSATRNLKYNLKSFQHNLPVGLKRWAHFERSHLQERNQGAIHSCKRWLLLHVLLRFLKISERLCSPAYLELPWMRNPRN